MHNPALIWHGGSLSYAEYVRQIFKIAHVLKKRGIGKGSRVAILSDIDHYFPLIFFALLRLQSIVIPINSRLPKKQIEQLLISADCQYLIPFDDKFLLYDFPDVSLISREDVFQVEITPINEDENLFFSLDQIATILFTSGSSGQSKAVVHSLGNHYYSALGSNENIVLGTGDKWLVTLPFYHVAAIAILFRSLLTGASVVMGQKQQSIYKQVKIYTITHLSLVPTQLYRFLEDSIVNNQINYLKAVLVGGSNCSNNLIDQAKNRRIPLFLSYGSTEMSSQITTTKPDVARPILESSGSLLAHRELKIGKDKEILVRGRTLAVGYWQGSKIKSIEDEKGWYHTGDLGYLDQSGQLVVIGRKDNMFISAGENIYPEEIENALLLNDDILDACVVALADDEYSTRPVSFIRMKEGVEINEEKIKGFLKRHLSGIKIPVKYLKWDMEDSLKADRTKLHVLAQEMIKSG